MPNSLNRLSRLGQSVWLDYIDRGLIDDGGLAAHVRNDALTGVTSNPTIFDKALADGRRYDARLAALVEAQPDADTETLFFALAMDDIRDAADTLRPAYEASEGRDGFVSLEVSPMLAHDADATVAQALWLVERIDRDNLMVKVPATRAGLPAIEALVARGVNVNVTLLFAVERYREVVEHWLRGLESRLERGLEIEGIASVASFFVSRVDAAVDRELEATDPATFEALRGRAAIANAATAYRHFLETVADERYARLAAAGAQPQRLLWASTATKNPDYNDVLYVEGLAGAQTVTTLPPATLEAFRDHGRAEEALTSAMDEADGVLRGIADAGIVLDAVTERLEHEGVSAFEQSYRHLLGTLEERRKILNAGT
ncbi:transaldolase [Arhodomonas sp. AD133]|uniref:transaldolase n=1 Tax=Arhodomonas sp. AD133 TaxID=3415009 RepID=UPI003EB8E023